MENLKLEALSRDDKESAKKIIKSGFVPTILYGAHLKENKKIKVKSIDVEKIFTRAGESTLIDLTIDGEDKSRKIIIKDFQKHHTKNNLIHLDFYEVDMNKEIHAQIPLRFIGEAKAVKELGGVLIKSVNEVEVKCLPKDLANHIDVDISSLNTLDDIIKLKQINLPPGIKLIHETDTVVANVNPIVEEEEEKTEAEEIPATEGEAPAQSEEKTPAEETPEKDDKKPKEK